jgi:methionine-rich copper-binding protein CopC
MVELNSPNSTWDGKISNGTDASEGVYFIKYRIVGPDGSEKIGQTFFHLVR